MCIEKKYKIFLHRQTDESLNVRTEKWNNKRFFFCYFEWLNRDYKKFIATSQTILDWAGKRTFYRYECNKLIRTCLIDGCIVVAYPTHFSLNLSFIFFLCCLQVILIKILLTLIKCTYCNYSLSHHHFHHRYRHPTSTHLFYFNMQCTNELLYNRRAYIEAQ